MAVYLCAGALVLARDDIGTWIAVGFLAFATLLGQAVWEGGGLVRSILPLYAFAFAAVLGGLRAGRSASARQPTRGSPRDHASSTGVPLLFLSRRGARTRASLHCSGSGVWIAAATTGGVS